MKKDDNMKVNKTAIKTIKHLPNKTAGAKGGIATTSQPIIPIKQEK